LHTPQEFEYVSNLGQTQFASTKQQFFAVQNRTGISAKHRFLLHIVYHGAVTDSPP